MKFIDTILGFAVLTDQDTNADGQVKAITVAKTENSTLLPNGNVIADLGSYTRTDGSAGGLGTATGQLDTLLKGWSNTSAMPTTATGAYGTRPLTIVFEGVAEGGPAYAAWLEKLSVLERNGRLQNIRRNETSWLLAA